MKVKCILKDHGSTIKVDKLYDVCGAIILSRNNKIELQYHIVNEEGLVRLYDSDYFFNECFEFNPKWVMLNELEILQLMPIEFSLEENFWERLGDFEEKAVEIFETLYPNMLNEKWK